MSLVRIDDCLSADVDSPQMFVSVNVVAVLLWHLCVMVT